MSSLESTQKCNMAPCLLGLQLLTTSFQGFRKVVRKHGKLTSVSLSWLETQKLRTFFVRAQSNCEQLLVKLSDIYSIIKTNSADDEDTGEHKVSAVSLCCD